MFRSSRVLLAVLTVCIALLCVGAYAQDLFGNGRGQQSAARPAQPPQAMSEAQKHFSQGLKLMQQRKVDQAIAEFQAAKKLAPKAPPIMINLAICYAQKHNFSAAEGLFREVIAMDPKGSAPTTKFAQARLMGILSAEGKNAQAIALAKKIAAGSPKDYDAQFTLGICYLQAKNFAGAASAFRSALAIKPNDPGATQNLGMALMNGKNYAEARKLFEKQLKGKDNPQLRGMAAFACEQMGDKAAAIAHYEKLAWKRLPQSPQAVQAMVRLYNSMNKPAESAKVLKKAASFYKNDYGINAEMGRQMLAQRKFKEAETYLLAARKVHSDFFVNMNLAMAEAQLNKLKEAQTYVQAALKQDPKNKQGLDLYAYCLSATNKTDAAMALYKKWEQYYPNDSTPHSKAAGMLLMRGKSDEAYKEYQKAMNKAPKDVTLKVSAAAALRNSNKLDEAVALLQKAMTAEPKNTTVMGALAEVYETQNKTDQAIDLYKKMAEAEPKSKEPIQRLAFAYDTKKDYTSEIAQYRKLVEMDPKDIQSAITVARVYDKADQLDNALAEIKKVSEAHADDDSAHVFYGDMLVKEKDFTTALAQYEILAKKADAQTKSYGYYKIGETQEKQGKHDEAIKAYKSCLEGMPSNPQALDALGKIYDDQKKTDEFLAYLKTQVETGKPDMPYDYLVTKYKDAKKADEAVKIIEPIAKKTGATKPQEMALAAAYQAADQNDKAIDLFKGLLAKHKDDLMLEMSLGELYKKTNKDQEAVDILKDLIKKVPDYVKLYLDLGDVYTKMDKKTEAVAAYKEALKRQPNNPEAKGKLDFLTNPKPAATTAPASGPVVGPAPAPGTTPAPSISPSAAPATPSSAPAPAPSPSSTPTPAPGPAPSPAPAGK